jgi:TolA-binding protein
MATRDSGHRGAAGARRWLTVTARVVGSGAVVTAIAIGSGMQLANSPSAIADRGDRPTPTFGGVVATPTATVSGVADPTSGIEYFSSLNGSFQNLQYALESIAKALNANDWDSVKAGCQQLAASGQQMRGTLPSPDSRATFRIQAAVDNISSASSACMALGPTSTQDDLNHMMSYINSANTDYKTVKQILAPGH